MTVTLTVTSPSQHSTRHPVTLYYRSPNSINPSPHTRIMASPQIIYRQYTGEADLPHIMALVQNELSEPYVIYTFRYFLHQWSVTFFPAAKRAPISLLGRVPPHLSKTHTLYFYCCDNRPHLSFLVCTYSLKLQIFTSRIDPLEMLCSSGVPG